MIIVDFSHLTHRNLYIAISQARPKKVDGKYVTKDFIKFYYHLILNSLRSIQKSFRDYGEIILAIDDRKYWRREIYPLYKKHRKKERDESDINFEEFFQYNNELIETLKNYFPYKVLQVDNAEADDIIGVLSKFYAKQEKVLVVTSDKDLKQVLKYSAEMYDPIRQQNIKMTEDELKIFITKHILLGDSSDNIPNIMQGTEFSPNFKAYLRENDIYVDDVHTFNKMSISEKLYNEYNIYKKNRKGDELDEKDIFKTVRFGEKTAEKFMENLKENLSKNPIYLENFKRNKKLISLDEIPEDLQNKILDEYKKLELHYDSNQIMSFLMKNQLNEHLMNISDFYIVNNSKNTAKSEEFSW